ncbi:alanyl-tRNA editing protein [Chromobacterium violaceum]|uniref:Alanine--tRNA ligase n=1 Tax=Chromobacterium violaceum TaxID=536 RepID=A0AAX2MFY1_CHRVL|nr:alanyl-tRNA editing protein [Chromobacterium violaceum]OLZ75375.1 alanyl-tRNA editing protein [Chromobacterium violaceum]STB69814.1 Alanine--tRNA ligase [Chromobacterium violaceum]SUX35163.1 Alanine--tRNA ligase [Chromobacterium violaceum]
MTIKRFWADPYQTELATRISRVDGERVWLEETIFYAFSGGQESDSGRIAGQPVRLAEKLGMDIAYTLDAGHGLQAGDAVAVEIDWPRRYRLMRLHFAAELVLEVICRQVDGVEKIGAHIAEDKARIDFALYLPITPLLADIAAAAQRLINDDLPIVSAFSDEAAGRRYWELPGFARVPCGGTHLKRSGEVGRIALKRRNIGKGKERVEIYLLEP